MLCLALKFLARRSSAFIGSRSSYKGRLKGLSVYLSADFSSHSHRLKFRGEALRLRVILSAPCETVAQKITGKLSLFSVVPFWNTVLGLFAVHGKACQSN